MKGFSMLGAVAGLLMLGGPAIAAPTVAPDVLVHPFENGCFNCCPSFKRCPPGSGTVQSPVGWCVTPAGCGDSAYLFGKGINICGSSGFAFGAIGGHCDVVSQTFTDSAGPATLSFCWGKNIHGCDAPGEDHFEALFGRAGCPTPTVLVNCTNFHTTAFRHFSTTVTLSGFDTLTFEGYQQTSFVDPTHVSFGPAVAAPEVKGDSAAIPVALAVSGLLMLADRRRKNA
ncbi:MAG TPA: hypothetical protein VGO93_13840 [Candidatus Xenobia bacterium]|jgi:hypothetical protein